MSRRIRLGRVVPDSADTLNPASLWLVSMLVLDKEQSDGADSLPFWQKLLILRLGQNNLTRIIPFTLGNLSSLQQLSVAFNHLEGGIPHDLRTLLDILTNSLSANALPNKLRFSNLNFFNRSIAQSSGSGSLWWIQ